MARFTQAKQARSVIEDYLANIFGRNHGISITCEKDYGMIELWDDRAYRIVANTGETCCTPLMIENDRLQQRVKSLEAKLQSIADQYAVDCL